MPGPHLTPVGVNLPFQSVFRLLVVRTFRSAVSGRPEGLHYIGTENV